MFRYFGRQIQIALSGTFRLYNFLSQNEIMRRGGKDYNFLLSQGTRLL